MGRQKPITPLWEKIVGVFGLALLCTGFIYLTWEKITTEKSPVHILFATENITVVDNQFIVSVHVRNIGFESVTALQIEGVLLNNGKKLETVSMQIDYLPSRSARNVGFFFKQNPHLNTLEFRALGYQAL